MDPSLAARIRMEAGGGRRPRKGMAPGRAGGGGEAELVTGENEAAAAARQRRGWLRAEAVDGGGAAARRGNQEKAAAAARRDVRAGEEWSPASTEATTGTPRGVGFAAGACVAREKVAAEVRKRLERDGTTREIKT